MPTKEQLQEKINAMSHDMLRMEVALADYRKRAADLFNALQEDCPEAAARLTPQSTPRGSQFTRIWNLINATEQWYIRKDEMGLLDCFESVRNFYSDHFENRRVLSDEHLAALAEGRKRSKKNV